jgi:hypothetical protein
MRPLASAKTIQDTITRLHVQARQIGAGTVAARAHKRCLSIPEKERRSDEERRRFAIFNFTWMGSTVCRVVHLAVRGPMSVKPSKKCLHLSFWREEQEACRLFDDQCSLITLEDERSRSDGKDFSAQVQTASSGQELAILGHCCVFWTRVSVCIFLTPQVCVRISSRAGP